MDNLILNDGWYYTIENSEVTIHGRTGDEMELIIPQFIEGFPVKHIESCAFKYDGLQGSKITVLKFPEGLLSIGFNAFFDHHIRDLEIPDSVTSIGNAAFYHICDDLFHTIKIPSNVELGRDAICEGFIEYYNICGKQAGTYIREGCWYKKGDNDSWSYYIKNGCAVITGYHGNETEVTIPSEINNIPVSTISGLTEVLVFLNMLNKK